MANGKPGAPHKSIEQRKVTFNYTLNRQIGEQLIQDTNYMGDTASNVVADFGRRYHELTEEIEVQKLQLQDKKVRRKILDIEIDEDEKRITTLNGIIKTTKQRANNPEYISDLQRIINRLIAFPKEHANIPERAKALASNYGYYRPMIKNDIDEAIAKSNGHRTIQSSTKAINGRAST